MGQRVWCTVLVLTGVPRTQEERTRGGYSDLETLHVLSTLIPWGTGIPVARDAWNSSVKSPSLYEVLESHTHFSLPSASALL